ncbi:MAG: aldolase/citrate lyase family protein [Vicinamibacterales bacterium]
MKSTALAAAAALAFITFASTAAPAAAQAKHENAVIDLWNQGKAVFGVYAPNEAARPRGEGPPAPGTPRPKPVYTAAGGEKLAANPLYDYVFLNLEGSYDAGAIKAIATGLRSKAAVSRKTLIVRIPSIEDAGADVTKARVKEAFDMGADGVTIPHVRGAEEAREAIGFFKAAGVDVWSKANPSGEKLAMLMLEDPGAVAEAREVADLQGYSILACGIGSLTGALKGDRAAAEAGNQEVLAETKRVGLVNMLTASPNDVEKRVKEGFLALLGQGPQVDEMIKIGRAAAGR